VLLRLLTIAILMVAVVSIVPSTVDSLSFGLSVDQVALSLALFFSVVSLVLVGLFDLVFLLIVVAVLTIVAATLD
jgi:uncharacterized membrane protein YgaE (UPF0421/DUF939 family)